MNNIKESLDTVSKRLSEERGVPLHIAQWYAYEICSRTLKEVKDAMKGRSEMGFCDEEVAEEVIETVNDCEFEVARLFQEVTTNYSVVAEDYFKHQY